jgi:hypothetical protein
MNIPPRPKDTDGLRPRAHTASSLDFYEKEVIIKSSPPKGRRPPSVNSNTSNDSPMDEIQEDATKDTSHDKDNSIDDTKDDADNEVSFIQ